MDLNKKDERTRIVEEMRKRLEAKRNAFQEKRRMVNLQKCQSDDNTRSVFQTTKPVPAQSRPKNFNSMTDLRRQSLIPRPADNKATSQIINKGDNIAATKSVAVKTKVAGNDSAKILNNVSKVNTQTKPVNQRQSILSKMKSQDSLKTVSSFKIPRPADNKPNSQITERGDGITAPKSESVEEKDCVDGNESAKILNDVSKANTQPKPVTQRQSVLGKMNSQDTFKTGVSKLSINATKQKPASGHEQHRQSVAPTKTPRQSTAPTKMSRQSTAPTKTLAPAKTPRPSVAAPSKTTQPRTVPSKNAAAGPLKSAIRKFIPEKSAPQTAKPLPTKLDKISNPKPKKLQDKTPSSKMSVFERLYQSKSQTATSARKETIFEQKNRLVAAHANRTVLAPIDLVKENVKKMRRSISAVHFKRIGKDELKNCFHRYSVGDGLNKMDLNQINEEQPHIINSIRSERKKVQFKPATPRPGELESKLKTWLQKRGKSVDSFHHLRCFGVHRSAIVEKRTSEIEPYDEENKENISVSISDDGSFSELMNDDEAKMKWRRASFNDSEVYSECTEATNKSPVSMETPLPKPRVDELLLGVLTDLSELIREGYDWEQSARWLRATRERWPQAPSLAAYWECRAALEECRGNLPRSYLCWEEAIAKGTETSKAEASLDQLLDKFMQLNISPGTTDGRPSLAQDLQSAKTTLKTRLIKFAVQNAKAKTDAALYTVTPVRRSSRLSTLPVPTPRSTTRSIPTPRGTAHPIPTPRGTRTPLLQLAASLRHIDEDIREKSVFVPNKLLHYSP